MATAKTCTFEAGQGAELVTVTLRSPLYPEQPAPRPNQIVGRTWGGAFQICDLGAAGADEQELTLAFRDLTRDEWDDLRDLIETTADWSVEPITYTDPWGTDHTNLHYLSGIPEAQSSKGDRWSLTLALAKDMEA